LKESLVQVSNICLCWSKADTN